MYNIAICNKNIKECTLVEKLINDYALEHCLSVQIESFYSGEALVKDIMSGNNIFDVYFIDTCVEKMNGIQVGKFIRMRYGADICSIVYFSSNMTNVLQLFEIMPISLIIRPFDKKKIVEAIKLAIACVNKNNQKLFSFRVAGMTYKVPVEEILYFESSNKIVNIYMANKIQSFYSTLSGIEEQLNSQQFFHIHKSYLVNWKYVIQYYYDKVLLTNKVELPISQTHRKEIRSIMIS